MKRTAIQIFVGLLAIVTQAFAGNGDLIVDGKLGVGTTASSSKLHVAGNISASGAPLEGARMNMFSWAYTGLVLGENSATFPGIALGGALRAEHGVLTFNNFYNDEALNASSGAAIAAVGDTVTQTDRGMHLDFFTRQSSGNTYNHAMRLSSSGNVGIGTTTPKTKLEVSGTKNTDQLKIYANTAAIDSRFSGYGAISIVGYDGTSTQSEIRSYSNLYFQHGSRLALLTSDALGNGPIERMRILENGYVGIGTSAPTQMLDVQGQVASNGVVLTSDLKFKEHLLPINTALDKVLNLTGHSYKWKTDEYKDKNFPEGRHYGVIAQEIEKVLPEVVKTDGKGNKSVAYIEIIPVLI